MNRTRILAVVCLLLASSVAVLAVEWTETNSYAALTTDPFTGAPAVVFSLSLAYDAAPSDARIHVSWKVYRVEGGSQTLIEEYARTSNPGGGVSNLHLASPPAVIEGGGQYRATVEIEDLVNGLTFAKTLSYSSPVTLPIGLHLVGWDGSEVIDLSELPDEELEELVMLHRLYGRGYELEGEAVDLDDLFRDFVPDDESYPVIVLLIPSLTAEVGSTAGPITITVSHILYMFTVPTADDVAGFRSQVEAYAQDTTGAVYVGPGGDGFGEGVVVFLQDGVWPVLEAATDEHQTRSG